MVKLEWGTKRTCQHCAARFYDLHRSPIICPKCSGVFEVHTSGRRGRNRAALELQKGSVAALEDPLLVDDLELVGDLEGDLEDADLIEDTDDLVEDIDDMSEVLEHVNEDDEGV